LDDETRPAAVVRDRTDNSGTAAADAVDAVEREEETVYPLGLQTHESSRDTPAATVSGRLAPTGTTKKDRLESAWTELMITLYPSVRDSVESQVRTESTQTWFDRFAQQVQLHLALVIDKDSNFFQTFQQVSRLHTHIEIFYVFIEQARRYMRDICIGNASHIASTKALGAGGSLEAYVGRLRFRDLFSNKYAEMAQLDRRKYPVLDPIPGDDLLPSIEEERRQENTQLRARRLQYWESPDFKHLLSRVVHNRVEAAWNDAQVTSAQMISDQLYASISALMSQTNEAASTITHDNKVYLPCPIVDPTELKKESLRDVRQWKDFVRSQRQPQQVLHSMRNTLAVSRQLQTQREDELAQLQNEDALKLVSTCNSIICFTQWVRLVLSRVREMRKIINRIPLVVLSSEKHKHQVLQMRQHWEALQLRLENQKRELFNQTKELRDDVNSTRGMLYDTARDMDMNAHRLSFLTASISMIQASNKTAHEALQDVLQMLVDEEARLMAGNVDIVPSYTNDIKEYEDEMVTRFQEGSKQKARTRAVQILDDMVRDQSTLETLLLERPQKRPALRQGIFGEVEHNIPDPHMDASATNAPVSAEDWRSVTHILQQAHDECVELPASIEEMYQECLTRPHRLASVWFALSVHVKMEVWKEAYG
jgi:hypothetical protein